MWNSRDAARSFLPYGFVRAIRRRNKGVVGSYRTWEEALQATGPYKPEMVTLIETVRRYRDREPSYLNRYDPSYRGVSYPLLAGLLTASVRCGGRLSVLDFGGSLGQTWFGLEWTLRHLPSPTMWCVVDQPECVAGGVPLFESDRLRFYASVPLHRCAGRSGDRGSDEPAAGRGARPRHSDRHRAPLRRTDAGREGSAVIRSLRRGRNGRSDTPGLE